MSNGQSMDTAMDANADTLEIPVDASMELKDEVEAANPPPKELSTSKNKEDPTEPEHPFAAAIRLLERPASIGKYKLPLQELAGKSHHDSRNYTINKVNYIFFMSVLYEFANFCERATAENCAELELRIRSVESMWTNYTNLLMNHAMSDNVSSVVSFQLYEKVSPLYYGKMSEAYEKAEKLRCEINGN